MDTRARDLGTVGGTMLTTVALVVDFLAGFSPPRHMYTGHVYRVWGNLPFEDGDYWTHGVVDVLYPGYERASYFHDEAGFLTATPHGDVLDALLTDAPAWLLGRYLRTLYTNRHSEL